MQCHREADSRSALPEPALQPRAGRMPERDNTSPLKWRIRAKAWMELRARESSNRCLQPRASITAPAWVWPPSTASSRNWGAISACRARLEREPVFGFICQPRTVNRKGRRKRWRGTWGRERIKAPAFLPAREEQPHEGADAEKQGSCERRATQTVELESLSAVLVAGYGVQQLALYGSRQR